MIDPLHTLATEILRLDSRGGADTVDEADYDPDAWPSDEAVKVALHVAAMYATCNKPAPTPSPWREAATPQHTWRAA